MSDRENYIAKAKARIDQWTAEIDRLEAKAREADADARLAYSQQIEEMRSQRDTAQEKLAELRQAGDSAWEDVKSGFDKAWDDMTSALDKATARFR